MIWPLSLPATPPSARPIGRRISHFWRVPTHRIPPSACILPVVYRRGPLRTGSSAPWRVLAQHALQRAAVHFEAAGGLRDVAVALLENALDMLPAHAVGRHRIGGGGPPGGGAREGGSVRPVRGGPVVGIVVGGAPLPGRPPPGLSLVRRPRR